MKRQFETPLRSDLFQVFLYACPANMPFFFATHPWFVVNKKGEVSRFGKGRHEGTRWEAFFEQGRGAISWGHVHQDALLPFEGIEIWPYSRKYHWRGRLLGYVEGKEGSLAHRMAEFIEHSGETYPYSKTYSLFGPNSNTYAQWILNHFPESGLYLGWRSVGKNYKEPV